MFTNIILETVEKLNYDANFICNNILQTLIYIYIWLKYKGLKWRHHKMISED